MICIYHIHFHINAGLLLTRKKQTNIDETGRVGAQLAWEEVLEVLGVVGCMCIFFYL